MAGLYIMMLLGEDMQKVAEQGVDVGLIFSLQVPEAMQVHYLHLLYLEKSKNGLMVQ